MAKVKWVGRLSNTEPYIGLGILKVRQGNKNAETFEFEIVENNKPYDLTGLDVLFSMVFKARKDHAVQQRAVVVDAKKGIIHYTMTEYDMQRPGRIDMAYFEFRDKEGNYVGSTQNFSYHVIKSVHTTCMDGQSYIVRLEEIFKLYEDYFKKNKQSWEDFVEANREILESIDPGGLILTELIDARGTFKSIQERLDSEKKDIEDQIIKLEKWLDFNDDIIFSQVPSGFKFVIEHDSEYQPDIKVTSYKNALGTESNGLDTGPVFGGETIYNVPTHLSYDRKKATIEMPLFYALKGDVSIPEKNTLVIINETNVLCFRISEAKIISGNYLGENPTVALKTPRDLEVVALDDNTIQLTWKKG